MNRKKTALLGLGLVLVVGIVVATLWLRSDRTTQETVSNQPSQSSQETIMEPDSVVFKRYAGSKSCKECHRAAYDQWKQSHHGLAERPVSPQKEGDAFRPAHTVKHGTQTSQIRATNDTYQIIANAAEDKKRSFTVERVIGTEPLKQFLVPIGDGRYQATELAVDSKTGEWFNVFGDEDRRPEEWGHWTNRGMNWNSMCATCHNTRLRKHYNAESDRYSTTMAEMGVSCESCHGPMADHVDWQRDYPDQQDDPTLPNHSPKITMDACGACHSRRSELTGDFHPGEAYLNHYSLVIPDESDTYYPDGQVNGENYVFTSFLSSKMHTAGVTCMDCHEPHSAELITQGNALCMRCHSGQRQDSPEIDPASHSHHKPGTAGGKCVDCHMPETVYMQRDPRRDHGFTIPDPLLTKQYGVPNACNRCHEDESTKWALKHVQDWYGDSMDRHTRERATWVAEAREGNADVVDDLLKMATEESNPIWRAVGTHLLQRWSGRSEVTTTLRKQTEDPSPFVRGAAAESLDPLAQQPNQAVRSTLRELLQDPVRKVRIDAAWSLRSVLDLDQPAATDLMRYLDYHQDQPSGSLQKGVFQFDRGNPKASLPYLRRAVEWDPNSAPIRHALAVSLSAVGKPSQAVEHLKVACELEPGVGDYHYRLGLAYNEAGKLKQAIQSLEKATELNPNNSRAWYNLGLGYSQANQPQKAIDTLLRAESINPDSPRIPYARATILVRLKQYDQAKQAAQRALDIAPNFQPAANLLRRFQSQAPMRRRPRP